MNLADACPDLSADCRVPGCVHTLAGDAAKVGTSLSLSGAYSGSQTPRKKIQPIPGHPQPIDSGWIVSGIVTLDDSDGSSLTVTSENWWEFRYVNGAREDRFTPAEFTLTERDGKRVRVSTNRP